MKITIAIVFAAFLSVILAAPLDDSHSAQILKSESDVGPESYKFGWETSDGQKHEEEGNLHTVAGEEVPSIAVRGSYSFTADDGQVYTVNYVADENGYQPEGAHLPSVPLGN